jgi:hypothetical protein
VVVGWQCRRLASWLDWCGGPTRHGGSLASVPVTSGLTEVASRGSGCGRVVVPVANVTIRPVRVDDRVAAGLDVVAAGLAEAVVEHVLVCFRSWDPHVSLEPVALGPNAETEEVAQADVQDVVKLVAAWFKRQAEDT